MSSNLIKKIITDKNGKRTTVWVNPNEKKKNPKLKELELEKLKLTNKAFKMFANSPKQMEVREEIKKLDEKIKKLKGAKNKE